MKLSPQTNWDLRDDFLGVDREAFEEHRELFGRSGLRGLVGIDLGLHLEHQPDVFFDVFQLECRVEGLFIGLGDDLLLEGGSIDFSISGRFHNEIHYNISMSPPKLLILIIK